MKTITLTDEEHKAFVALLRECDIFDLGDGYEEIDMWEVFERVQLAQDYVDKHKDKPPG